MRYFEVEFAHKKEIEDNNFVGTPDRYSICILGERQPSYEEAEDFCRKDMEGFGYDMVSDVMELTEDEAYTDFDMECCHKQEGCKFPIFK